MRAIFLDRDGVINHNRSDHVKSWQEFEFLPGALHALRWLHEAGFHVFVVTNQAAVGRQLMSASALDEIHAKMRAQVAQSGGRIHDLRYCPHQPHEGCPCRKPGPGMILDLARRWRVDLSSTFLVGDACTDIGAAHRAGCSAILVRTGRGAEQLQSQEYTEDPAEAVVEDLSEAVLWLFQREGLLTIRDGRGLWHQPTSDLLHATQVTGI